MGVGFRCAATAVAIGVFAFSKSHLSGGGGVVNITFLGTHPIRVFLALIFLQIFKLVTNLPGSGQSTLSEPPNEVLGAPKNWLSWFAILTARALQWPQYVMQAYRNNHQPD